MTTSYLINILPTPRLESKSPYKILFKEKPSYEHLQVFSCFCYVYNKLKPLDNFESRSKCCIHSRKKRLQSSLVRDKENS